MPNRIGAYTYTILIDGSGRGTLRDQDSSAQIAYFIAWTDLVGFCLSLKGGWTLTGTTISYAPPDQHATFTNFYCKEMTFEPIGKPTALHTWEYAKVVATYGPLSFDPNTGNPSDAISEELNFTTKAIVLPPGSTKSESSGDPLVRPFIKKTGVAEYHVVMNSMPQLPGGSTAAIFGLLGKVNASTFKGATAKKMLFEGARAFRSAATFSALNSQNWKIDLAFTYQDIGWDHGYDNNGALGVIKFKDGTDIYETGDLSTLLPS